MKSIILYTTKYGSVRATAELLKKGLSSDTVLFDIAHEPVPPLDSYDTVILGGSVYMGRVQKKLTDFITSNLESLLKKRIGLFLCAGFKESSQNEKELKDNFPPELYSGALAKDVLGYRFDFDKMGFLDKFIVSKMSGSSKSVTEFYDDKIAQFISAMNA